VTLTLPDTVENFRLTPEEIRLELACALYSRGVIGRVGATELAGVDFFAFQRALGERGIPIVTEQMLEDDVASLKSLFPS
jgi:predicted HTH domain antitoxin